MRDIKYNIESTLQTFHPHVRAPLPAPTTHCGVNHNHSTSKELRRTRRGAPPPHPATVRQAPRQRTARHTERTQRAATPTTCRAMSHAVATVDRGVCGGVRGASAALRVRQQPSPSTVCDYKHTRPGSPRPSTSGPVIPAIPTAPMVALIDQSSNIAQRCTRPPWAPRPTAARGGAYLAQ